MVENRIDKLQKVAEGMPSETQRKRELRKKNRELIRASTAIASKICRAMRLQNLKNNDLAAMLGVAPGNISRYISGSVNFELTTLLALQKALNINLLNLEDDYVNESKINEHSLNIVFTLPMMVLNNDYVMANKSVNQLDYYEG